MHIQQKQYCLTRVERPLPTVRHPLSGLWKGLEHDGVTIVHICYDFTGPSARIVASKVRVLLGILWHVCKVLGCTLTGVSTVICEVSGPHADLKANATLLADQALLAPVFCMFINCCCACRLVTCSCCPPPPWGAYEPMNGKLLQPPSQTRCQPKSCCSYRCVRICPVLSSTLRRQTPLRRQAKLLP